MKPTKSYEAALWRVALIESDALYNGERWSIDYNGREWISWVYGKTPKTIEKDLKKIAKGAEIVGWHGVAKAKKMGVEVVVD